VYIAGVPKVPSHSPTHQEVEPGRLAALGLELEDIAEDDAVSLAALVELAEDRGRKPSHYLAAIPLETELRVQPGGASGLPSPHPAVLWAFRGLVVLLAVTMPIGVILAHLGA
jgi:hypothetical protein